MSRRRKQRAAPAIAVQDAYSNPLFGTGYGSQSPLEAVEYPTLRLTENYALLNSLDRDQGIVRSVISVIPDDMTREWFTLTGPASPEQISELERMQRVTGLRESVNEGLRWGRLYGGAAGLIWLDGQETILDQPLELGNILPGSFAGLPVFDRWCGVTPGTGLVMERGKMVPEFYTVSLENGAAVRVHHSRIVRFLGADLPFQERQAALYWGLSEIEPVYGDIVLYDSIMHNMGALTFQANINTMEVQNLDQLFSLASGEAQRRFWNTMQAQAKLRSNFGVQVVNKGDQMHNAQYTFTGFDHVTEAAQLNLSAKTHIPMTKLFGRSPAGMNATGESDLQNYYDYIDALRESRLRPILEQLLPVLCMSAWGSVPEGLEIVFPPLWTPTAKEVAEIGKAKTEAVVTAYTNGLLNVDTAQRELKNLAGETGLFDSITDEEIAANKGKSYRDATALRDPLMGLDFEGETDPFEQMTGDAQALDYKGQPRTKNGRFTYGKLSGTSTTSGKRGKMKSQRMSKKEAARVSSGILTDHPDLKPGPESHTYFYGKYGYNFSVNGPGDYLFRGRFRLK